MKKTNRILTVLLPIQVVFVNWLSYYPEIIENYYSNGVYPIISSFFRIILGWIPFSIGDILLFITLIFILKNLWQLITFQKSAYKDLFFRTGRKLSILYFCFYAFWGLNYYRVPLQKSMHLKIPDYNIEELTVFTESLLIKTQEIHFKLTKNDTIPVQTVFTQAELLDKTKDGYHQLAKIHPQFTYTHPEIKKSLFSTPMSYMGFSGYLNPLTGESQVSYNLLNFSIPGVACHEVAHQVGYANEGEANFVGYLAAINNKDLLFQYSGYILALDYALGGIYKNDKDLYHEIRNRLPKGVKLNLKTRYELYKKYKNPLMPYFHNIYSRYLKVNHQKNGMKSYSEMVGLLMAYESQKINLN